MTFTSARASESGPWFVWLGITDNRRLSCSQCHPPSEPKDRDDTTTLADWVGVIDQAAERGARMVQFVGGEPMLHPHLPDLIRHALARKVEVEVYSDLVRIPPAVWHCLMAPGVRVATGFFGDEPVKQGCLTGCDRLSRKSVNIRRLIAARVRLRVGDVDPRLGRGIGQAVALLSESGVTDLARDRVRLVGRLATEQMCEAGESCAWCGDDATGTRHDARATGSRPDDAVSGTRPDGGVAGTRLYEGVVDTPPDNGAAPCPMSRWLSARNLLEQPPSAATGRVAEPVLPAAWARTESRRPPCEPSRGPDIAGPDVAGPGGCRPGTGREDRKPVVGVCASDVLGDPGAQADSPAVTVADGEATGP
ncbi:radical SAM protein [Nonomuraea longicatena]|uniref:Radical SAM protein n=1 Tax=Nonomuraea longicatena TaxID=83682 RepID=A0ABN1NNI3_9ACTN